MSNGHPYSVQLLTFWLALIPALLLFLVIIGAMVRRMYRHRHAQHKELLNKLLNK